jgi:hypothetical protein
MVARQLSELTVALIVAADLALIVLFALTLQFARWAAGGADGHDASLLSTLTWEIAGSLAFGAIAESLFAPSRRTRSSAPPVNRLDRRWIRDDELAQRDAPPSGVQACPACADACARRRCRMTVVTFSIA